MKRLLLAVALFLCAPIAANAQCNGNFPAGAVCGNPDGSSKPPKATTAIPGTSSTFIQAGTGAVTRTMQDKERDIVNIKDFGADPTGVADSTTAITNALASSAYRVRISYGTYKFSANIAIVGNKVIDCDSGGTQLIWNGGNNATLFTAIGSYSGITNCTVDALTATGITGLLLTDAQYGNYKGLNFLRTGSASASGVALRLQSGVFGTGSAYNTQFNDFTNFQSDKFAVGFQCDGIATGPTVVTGNTSTGMYHNHATIGYRFVQWCDTNFFKGSIGVGLGTANGFGVIYNDSATPASDVGVYNNNFDQLWVNAFGPAATNPTAVRFNVTKQNLINLYLGVDLWPGTIIDDVSSRAYSYCVNLMNNGDNTNNISTRCKNWFALANGFNIADATDATKQIKFDVSGITTGTTRTFTMPDASTTLVGTGTTQTLANKTLTSPSIATGTLTGISTFSTGAQSGLLIQSFLTNYNQIVFKPNMVITGGATADNAIYYNSPGVHNLQISSATKVQIDGTATAGNTALLLWDVDNAALERVTIGVADSGGAGFKVLRIPN